MKRNVIFVSGLVAASVLLASSKSMAALLSYDFTGGSLSPTLVNVPSGVVVSSLSIGGGLDLSGATDALRFQTSDTQPSTATAISNSAWLTFTITVGADTVVNLTSLSANYTSTVPATLYSNSRVFSNIQGFDSAVNDTIGIIGQVANVPGSFTNLSLADPTLNATRGSNVMAGDFTGLTNRSITFYLPWVDNDPSNGNRLDLEDLTMTFDVVPEPSVMLSVGAGGLLGIFRRHRRRK